MEAEAQDAEEPYELANRLGVEIVDRVLPPTLWGATPNHRKVIISSRLSPQRRHFALAHELAHVLVRRTGCSVQGGEFEEAFADEFAGELLFRWWTRSGGRAPVEPWVLVWHDMKISTADRHQRVGDMTVCTRCGPRRRWWACPCGQLRQAY